MRTNWEVAKPSLWTGAGGVVVGMLLLSYGFGFMSRTTADKLASTSSERAVIAVLAPVCAANFRALPDVAARTAILVADKDNSYKMREAFPEAMITLPGKSYPDSDLTAACAGLILRTAEDCGAQTVSYRDRERRCGTRKRRTEWYEARRATLKW